jgi:hypothetical protein
MGSLPGSLFQNSRNKKWAPTAHFPISPMFLLLKQLFPAHVTASGDPARRILAPNKKASRGGFLAPRKIW